MATSMVMPQMGYDMHEGKVVRWLKQEGEEVIRGEIIAEIETDKATVEYEAYTGCLLYTSPSPRDGLLSRMPSSA